MKRFFIESPHSATDCLRVLKDFMAAGYLTHFEWGCKAKVHSGWALVDAEDETQARLMVPTLIRDKARVVELNSFTREKLEEEERIHKEKMANR